MLNVNVIQYIFRAVDKLVFNPNKSIICNLRPFYMIRLLQGHHQGGLYKGTQIQQILSKMCCIAKYTIAS